MKRQPMFVVAAAIALLVVGAGHGRVRAERTSDFVYTMSNTITGNRILAFDRGPGGALIATGSFATGGLGSGGGLGNQGAEKSRQDMWHRHTSRQQHGGRVRG